MATITLTKSVTTLIAAATSNAAGATTRGTADLRTALGGLLTIKLTNGGTGPTAQAVANILVAHDTGATPTAASRGTAWKTAYSVGNGTAANTIGEWTYQVPSTAMHVEVEVTGNTGQAVTCEAFLSKLDSASSV
jgi:hypothetical protein